VCPCTPWPHDMVLVARDVRGPWPDHVQRDTTSDGMLALGHSRSGVIPSLAAQQVALSHGRPAQGTLVELTLRGWKSAATIGRLRNP
jgi:hypothetical protein